MCGRSSSSKSVAHLQAIVGAAIYGKAAAGGGGPGGLVHKKGAGGSSSSSKKPAPSKGSGGGGGKSFAGYYPAFNKSPGTVLPVIRNLSKEEQAEAEPGSQIRVLQPMLWGLIPSYEPIETRRHNIMSNARAETIMGLKAFKRLVHKQRCVLAVEGFFEWHSTTNQLGQEKKEPYFITPQQPFQLPQSARVPGPADESSAAAESAASAASQVPSASSSAPSAAAASSSAGDKISEAAQVTNGTSLLYMASLYDVAPPDNEGEEDIVSFTVLTCEPSKDFDWLHDRMPVILRTPADVERWLDCDTYSFEACKDLLRPQSGSMKWYRVTDFVNSIRNQGDECVLPYEVSMAKRHSSGLGRFFSTVSKDPSAASSGSSSPLKETAAAGGKQTGVTPPNLEMVVVDQDPDDQLAKDAAFAAALSAELNAGGASHSKVSSTTPGADTVSATTTPDWTTPTGGETAATAKDALIASVLSAEINTVKDKLLEQPLSPIKRTPADASPARQPSKRRKQDREAAAPAAPSESIARFFTPRAVSSH